MRTDTHGLLKRPPTEKLAGSPSKEACSPFNCFLGLPVVLLHANLSVYANCLINLLARKASVFFIEDATFDTTLGFYFLCFIDYLLVDHKSDKQFNQ